MDITRKEISIVIIGSLIINLIIATFLYYTAEYIFPLNIHFYQGFHRFVFFFIIGLFAISLIWIGRYAGEKIRKKNN